MIISFEMLIDTWKNSAGTTVSCVIMESDKFYVANVGDSTVILGQTNPDSQIIASIMTDNHKPYNYKEKQRIELLGGSIAISKGETRVVYERKEPSHIPEVYNVHRIPYLNMTRSLGDFWSTVEDKQDHLISPVPDVTVHLIDVTKDRFIVIASDGLWDVLKPQEVAEMIDNYCKSEMTGNQVVYSLIETALQKWRRKDRRADNISVIIIFFCKSYNLQSLWITATCKR